MGYNEERIAKLIINPSKRQAADLEKTLREALRNELAKTGARSS
jgi:hypothetical protein